VRIWAVFLLIISAQSANAGFYTGNDVFPFCASNRSFVSGFVAGAFDKGELDSASFFNYVLMAPAPPNNKKAGPEFDGENFGKYANEIQQYCTPKNANLAQVVDIYCQYLTTNPATRHLSAATLFNHALTKAWQCAPVK
jgi:Rap1a immunity proteins